MLDQQNDFMVLIGGESGAGKSTSLMNIKNPEGVLYLNCDAGKKLPFRNKFNTVTVTHPMQVLEGIKAANESEKIHTVIIDTLSFLMEMYETQIVLRSDDTRSAWGDYAQYLKTLMQEYIAGSTKNIIILSHIADYIDESSGTKKVQVPLKGASAKVGVEAYLSVVVNAKKVPIIELEKYPSKYLNITEEERIQGFKHVFQTKVTAKTTAERIRGPIGMFKANEVYMDNDVQMLLDILHEYYEA